MRRSILFFVAISLASTLAYLLFNSRPSHSSRIIPVLVYHIITEKPQAVASPSVQRDLLARELDYLGTHSYTTLTFEEAVNDIKSEKLPRNSVILSFDDADEGQYLYAFPLLRARHMRAAFFPPSGWIGKTGKMTWDELRTLQASGMEIGGHSKTHPHLFGLNDPMLEDEITVDKTELERGLGSPVETFAYPYGEVDPRILEVVRAAGYAISRAADPEPQQDISGHYLFGARVMTNSFEIFLAAVN